MDTLRFSQKANCQLVPASDIKLEGRYVIEHWRGGKRINEYRFRNAITNEGKNSLLNVMFHGATPIASWFIGLIDSVGYSALANTDTYDDINQAANGWKEFTNYTDANNSGSATTRPAWPEDAASGQSISNASVAIFDITASGTAKGIFICGGTAGAQTKGDHVAGAVLWSAALFGSGDVAVQSGDQLKITYTVTA